MAALAFWVGFATSAAAKIMHLAIVIGPLDFCDEIV
jgi:hypothetical protein